MSTTYTQPEHLLLRIISQFLSEDRQASATFRREGRQLVQLFQKQQPLPASEQAIITMAVKSLLNANQDYQARCQHAQATFERQRGGDSWSQLINLFAKKLLALLLIGLSTGLLLTPFTQTSYGFITTAVAICCAAANFMYRRFVIEGAAYRLECVQFQSYRQMRTRQKKTLQAALQSWQEQAENSSEKNTLSGQHWLLLTQALDHGKVPKPVPPLVLKLSQKCRQLIRKYRPIKASSKACTPNRYWIIRRSTS